MPALAVKPGGIDPGTVMAPLAFTLILGLSVASRGRYGVGPATPWQTRRYIRRVADSTDLRATAEEPRCVPRTTPWVWPPVILISMAAGGWLDATWGPLLGMVVIAGAMALLACLRRSRRRRSAVAAPQDGNA